MRRIVEAIFVSCCALYAVAQIGARPTDAPATRALIHEAFAASFNLDYDQAHAAARRAVDSDPSSSAAHRIVAWTAWNHILYLRGAVTIDYYLGGTMKSLTTLPKPPGDLEGEFHRELDRSIALAEAAVQKNRKDVEAEYDLGAAYGLQASYMASVEGRMTAAFGSARHAYDAHEKVLSMVPDRSDAGVIVGTYRYLVASFSLPMRMFAYVAGFGGGKAKGIEMLETAAKKGQYPEDAEFALIMIYSRESRNLDALQEIRALEREFPRNRLLVLEEASTLMRGGKAIEAEPILSAGLARLDEERRLLAFDERAQWLYKRGAARVTLGRVDGAERDLTAALAANPAGWVTGRIHLEMGKLADLEHNRPRALNEYRVASTTCRENGDPLCQSDAERLTHKPFAQEPREIQ